MANHKTNVMYKHILFLFLILISLNLCGQNELPKVQALLKENKTSEAELILERYETSYTAEEKWDSLLITLNLKAKLYTRIRGMQEGIDIFEKAEMIAHEHNLNQTKTHYDIRISKSNAQTIAGLYADASKSIEELLANDAISKYEGYLEKVMVRKATLLLYQNKRKEAKAIFLEITPNVELQTDTSTLIDVYNNLAYIYNFYGSPDSSLVYGLKSLQIAKAKFGAYHPNVGILSNGVANAYLDLENFNLSLEYYNKSKNILLKEFKQNNRGQFLSATISNLGLLYNSLGEYKLAQQHAEFGLELAMLDYPETDINLLWYHDAVSEMSMKNNDFDKALSSINNSLSIIDNNAEATEYDKIFSESIKHSIDYELGNYASALKNSLEVYDYFVSVGQKYSREGLSTASLISNCYFGLEDYDNSLKWNLINKEIVDTYYPRSHSQTILSLNSLLEIYIILNDTLNIVKTKDQILLQKNNGSQIYTLDNCIPDVNILAFATVWAEYLGDQMKKNPKWSEEYFSFLNEFESYFELHISTLRSNNSYSKNAEHLEIIYRPAISHYLQTEPEISLLYIEKIRAFLTRLIVQSQLIDQDSVSTSSMNKLQSTLINLSDSNRVDLFIETGNAIESYHDYKDSLFENNIGQYQKLFGFDNINITTIKDALYQNECLIEYYKNGDQMYIIGYDGNQYYTSYVDYYMVDSLVQEIIINKQYDVAKQLYALIVPAEIATKYDHLLIVPDQVLCYLNFDQLIDQHGNYLIENKTIRYAHSASVLKYQKLLTNQHRATNNIFTITPGFTSNLKNAYLQDSSIFISDTSWFDFIQQPFLLNLAINLSQKNNSNGALLENATEENFKQNNQNFKIIHLGTHGILDDKSPLFSKLIFAKDKTEDGYLHTYEVYGQNLNADLAVLSACNSGNGLLTTGDGIVSLAHAFTHAGCPSVLMTLWEVDEKTTSNILEYFYNYLLEGDKKSVALNKAKKRYIAEAPVTMKDPYYWAGLVLIGDDSPLYSDGSFYYYILGLILLGVFGYWWFWKR